MMDVITNVFSNDKKKKKMYELVKTSDVENPDVESMEKIPEIAKENNTLVEELWAQLRLGFPISFALVLEFLPSTVSVAFVGQYSGHIELDASALATRLLNMGAMATGFGFCGVLETLASQSKGAGKSEMVGFYFQQAMGVLMAMFIPVILAVFHTQELLGMLSFPETLHEPTKEFALWSLPGVFVTLIYELFRKVLQPFEIVAPFIHAAIFGLFVEVGMCWVLLSKTDIGFIGAAYARFFGNAAMVLYIIAYIYIHGHHKLFWRGWNVEAFYFWKWGTWLKLGIPGIMHIGFEWWAFEIYIFFCGWLDHAEIYIAVQSILVTVAITMYMVYAGFGSAAGIRAGVALGKGDGLSARKCAMVGFLNTGILGFIGGATLLAFSGFVTSLFIGDQMDPEISILANKFMIYISLYQVCDSMNSVSASVMKACGKQGIAAIVTFVAFWLCGVFLGYEVAFQESINWGFGGLQVTLVLATFVSALLTNIYFFCILDWEHLGLDIAAQHNKSNSLIHGHD